jgi:hypothetical protein
LGYVELGEGVGVIMAVDVYFEKNLELRVLEVVDHF